MKIQYSRSSIPTPSGYQAGPGITAARPAKTALGQFSRLTLAWLAALFIAVVFPDGGSAAVTELPEFRVGFASDMFADVNENDAKAAVKVWGLTVAREHGVPTDPEPQIFSDDSVLFQSFRNQLVDAAVMTTPEFYALGKEVRLDPIFVMHEAGKVTVQYILLVHRDSKIESLADLRGRTLAFHRNPRLSLAQVWLDTLLAQEGFPPCSAFAGNIRQVNKLSNVILPVFFHAADACVVTRAGFEMMVELNPQVGRQLKVIATSMELVPFVLAFRADYQSPFKDQLLTAFRDLHKTPAGLQILNIFHGDKLEDLRATGMNSALELLGRHAQLVAGAEATRPLPPSRAAQTSGGTSP